MTIHKRFYQFLMILAIALGVSQIQAAEIKLAWNAPTANYDGTPLNDLDGYLVYYGTTPGQYQDSVDVGLENQACITGLQAGVTYYFAVQAYNCWGYGGDLSQEISATTALSTEADADLDGMPDSWEIANFGSVSSINGGADEDYDADGFGNLEEYIAGTSPSDASSGPNLTVTLVRKYLNYSFDALKAGGGLNRYYTLERADSPTAATWNAVSGYSRILGQNQVVTFVERTRKHWYYRLNIWLE